MIINIDYRKKEPIYEQIVYQIERYVSLGVLKEGDKLQSVRTLAIELGINPNTVKKAYDILENHGVIESLSTKGSFISGNTSKIKKEKINQILNDIEDKIKELETLGLNKKDIIERLK